MFFFVQSLIYLQSYFRPSITHRLCIFKWYLPKSAASVYKHIQSGLNSLCRLLRSKSWDFVICIGRFAFLTQVGWTYQFVSLVRANQYQLFQYCSQQRHPTKTRKNWQYCNHSYAKHCMKETRTFPNEIRVEKSAKLWKSYDISSCVPWVTKLES